MKRNESTARAAAKNWTPTPNRATNAPSTHGSGGRPEGSSPCSSLLSFRLRARSYLAPAPRPTSWLYAVAPGGPRPPRPAADSVTRPCAPTSVRVDENRPRSALLSFFGRPLGLRHPPESAGPNLRGSTRPLTPIVTIAGAGLGLRVAGGRRRCGERRSATRCAPRARWERAHERTAASRWSRRMLVREGIPPRAVVRPGSEEGVPRKCSDGARAAGTGNGNSLCGGSSLVRGQAGGTLR